MIVYYEERRRVASDYGLTSGVYRVRSWYLFGHVLIFRRWEQLTTSLPTPSERSNT